MAESEEESKSLLMKVKEKNEKAGLKLNIHKTKIKLNIHKTKIMASGPISSRQIDWEKMEIVRDFILGGSKITADGDCSHVIKRCLLLGRKPVTSIDNVFKSRDTTLPTKVHIVKVMVFPVVMYKCESWTKKRLSTEEMPSNWCWRRFLRVTWTARISNQSILKEIKPEYSLEGLMLKLKL